MDVKDKFDQKSREGSGRVGIYKETDLTHVYTLEAHYTTGMKLEPLPKCKDMETGKILPESMITNVESQLYIGKSSPEYNLEIFEDVG